MLYGENVRLRAAEREDLPRFVTWMNDPDVRDGLALCLPLSLAQDEKWFARALEGPAEEFPLVIEIRAKDSWRPIGSCGLKGITWRNRSASVGIAIGERGEWNHGYGAEALCVLLRHGFETLNLHRIWLQVFAGNARAIRCYEKIGFVQEGRLRQAEYRHGRYDDVVVMSVLRPEWESRRPAGG